MINATNEFRRFTENQDLAYLAHYYIAFGKWQSVLAQLNQNMFAEGAVRMLDEAITELKISIRLKEGFADAYALSLNCHYPLYYLEPQRSGELIPNVAAMTKKALELAPNNPRIVLTVAQNIFYTPEQYGGSQERGIARYLEAIRLFEKTPNQPPSVLPSWGHEIAYAWLGSAYLNLKKPNVTKALEAFENALELRPDFAWVKDTMLPQVRKQLK